MRRWCVLVALVLGCGKEDESGFPLTDGTSVPIPLECRAEQEGKTPYSVKFNLHNAGIKPVFLAIEYNCSPRAAVSSCARNFDDDLLWHGGNICPCEGSCPVGGPGCEPIGKEMAPGAVETLNWQASITVQSKRNGEACSAGSRDLPAGRYRLTVPAFASAEDTIAPHPPLFVISKDFELPGAATIDVFYVAP